MIKLFQKWLVLCLAYTLLGCQASSPSAVVVEEKDVSNELLKQVARISDQSDAHTVQTVIFDLIFNTYSSIF